jgi:hypothetical protein
LKSDSYGGAQPAEVAGHDAASAFNWDPSQQAVIEASAEKRLIVDAGPGTGKTAVACARLGHLVLTGEVRPSQVWMISFTRTAIAEIRARLQSYIGDAAFAVKVATVDAHAWAIHSGYDPSASLTGSYEENIERVLTMVKADDDVMDYLENVEHLIVDEAQDLVGERAELIEAIISRLDPACGVTVFADEAQAIYGFSEDEDSGAVDSPVDLLTRLRSNASYRFEGKALDTIHRTSAVGLRAIFSDVRATVLDGRGDSEGLFARTRQSIANHADGGALDHTDLRLDTLPAGSLVLFRTRAEALVTSQFCKVPHSLRLSGYGSSLPPWLALCFSDWTEAFMSLAEFMTRWTSRIRLEASPEYGPDRAWEKLLRLGGSSDGSLEMARLRRALARRSAPVDLAMSEFGLPGPIIGTIHASKGREADSVLLLAAENREFKTAAAEEEETRVLFVGSTRARQSLRVGKAIRYAGARLQSGRCFKQVGGKGSAKAMVEIGREEDFLPSGIVGNTHSSVAEALASQDWLRRHANAIMSFNLQRDGDLDWTYRLMPSETSMTVAVSSRRLRDDFHDIAKRLSASSGSKFQSPSNVRYVRALGCRTIVVGEDDPEVGRLHAPWSQSGFLLAPRVAAFTTTFFWAART